MILYQIYLKGLETNRNALLTLFILESNLEIKQIYKVENKEDRAQRAHTYVYHFSFYLFSFFGPISYSFCQKNSISKDCST